MDLPAAVAEPRIHGDEIRTLGVDPEMDLPEITWEEGIPSDIRNELVERGHSLSDSPGSVAALQAIMIEDDEYIGTGSPRRDGHAEGL